MQALVLCQNAGALAALILWTALIFWLARRAAAEIQQAPFHIPRCALAAALFVAAAAAWDGAPKGVLSAAICIALIAGGAVDARTGYLVDAVTLPAALLGLIGACFLGCAQQALAGAAATSGVFGALHFLSRGSAIGLGDVKAMYALGVTFGAGHAAFAVVAAALAALIAAFARGMRTRGAQIRFGPYLAGGAALTFFTMGN